MWLLLPHLACNMESAAATSVQKKKRSTGASAKKAWLSAESSVAAIECNAGTSSLNKNKRKNLVGNKRSCKRNPNKTSEPDLAGNVPCDKQDLVETANAKPTTPDTSCRVTSSSQTTPMVETVTVAAVAKNKKRKDRRKKQATTVAKKAETKVAAQSRITSRPARTIRSAPVHIGVRTQFVTLTQTGVPPKSPPKPVESQDADTEKRLERLRRAFAFLKKRQEEQARGFQLDTATFSIIEGATNVPTDRGFVFDSPSNSPSVPRSISSNKPSPLPQKSVLKASASSFQPASEVEQDPFYTFNASDDQGFCGAFDNHFDSLFEDQVGANSPPSLGHQPPPSNTHSPFSVGGNHSIWPIMDCDDLHQQSTMLSQGYVLQQPSTSPVKNSIRVVSGLETVGKGADKGNGAKVRILPPDNAGFDPLSITSPFMSPFGYIGNALAMTHGGILPPTLTHTKPKFTISILPEADADAFESEVFG